MEVDASPIRKKQNIGNVTINKNIINKEDIEEDNSDDEFYKELEVTNIVTNNKEIDRIPRDLLQQSYLRR